MGVADSARRATAGHEPSIDVLAFPPDQAELQRRQAHDMRRWRELERRARVALFFGAGMFLAWAADVGAAFEIDHAGGSALFGMASVPIATSVAMAYLYGRWALERAGRGRAQVQRYYADVTVREAAPLLQLGRNDAVIAQYLRCVGRQRRALSAGELIALQAWAEKNRPTHGPAAFS